LYDFKMLQRLIVSRSNWAATCAGSWETFLRAFSLPEESVGGDIASEKCFKKGRLSMPTKNELHEIARAARDNGTWKTNPDPLLDFGADLIANNISTASQKFPALTNS
jgi:hypothetical protein